MIISQLTGGLGNQFFQYAAGLARANKEQTLLKIDTSLYKNDKKRAFLLDNFSISAKKANWMEILLTKIFKPKAYLTDYFQSELYFKDIDEIIRKEFTLNNPLENKYPNLTKKIKETNSVSVHIRRTDYLDKQHLYIILTPEYYKKAMDKITEKISRPVFFFFSDDIEWVKQNLSCPIGSIFMSNGAYKDYEELIFMTLCKHNITANSTFSWWGAWLNQNKEKIIITPKNWQNSPNKTDIVPKNWLKI